MDWTLYPEEWSLLAAVGSLILVLVLTFVFGVRWRLAWSQLPAATRDAELTMLVTRRETQLYDLEQQKKALEDDVRNLESRVLERDRLEAEADHWKSQVEVAKAEYAGLDAMRREVEEVREEYRQALEKLGETETQVGQAKGALEDLRQRAEAVTRQIATTEGEIEDRGNALEELRQKVDETKAVLTRELAELTEARRALEETRERESRLTREIETLEARQRSHQEILRQQEDQLEGTKNELEGLAAARRDLEPAQKELEATEKKLDDRNQRVARLRSEEGQLNAQIAQLKGERQASEGDGDPLKDLRTPPTCLGRKGERPAPDEGEAAALERVRNRLKESGFDFHDRQIKAFHTSLKTAVISPLTVLAGISGTGKSQLPRYYAEAMGMQFLKMSVQPRWDGPQDLFGFYNYIESRYRATDLARALVHLDPYNWAKEAEPFRDRMLLVLLDEMNLARVEYYFSEFLSRLEGRPLDDGATDGASRGPSEIEIDVSRSGQNGEEGQSRRVYVGQNVLFVGTMNEDESTQSLSDKVLDRANVLRFPKPEKLKTAIPEPKPGKQRGYLPKSRWLGPWRRSAGDLDDVQRVRGYIQDINDIMARIGRPFGHRTGQAMLHYAANYPDAGGANATETAISDQIEVRILPRLRGVSTEGHDQPLHDLHKFVNGTLKDEELGEALRHSMDASRDSGDLFVWPGLTRR